MFVSTLKRMWFGPREIIKGVPFFIDRDNVEGRTFYYHGRDPRKCGSYAVVPDHVRGIYPYIEVQDAGGIKLWVTIASNQYVGLSSVVMNVQRQLVSWEGRRKSRTLRYWWGTESCEVIEFLCDAAWEAALGRVARGSQAVVRFKGEEREDQKDFEVRRPNAKLVAEVLEAYRFLDKNQKEQAAPNSARPEGASPPVGDPIDKGPFHLWPDGSITDRDSRLHLPPGAQVGELRLDGYALRSHPAGYYVITNPEGRATAHRFRGGRWEQAPARAAR